MMRTPIAAAVILLMLPLAGMAHAADPAEIAILGKDPGTSAAYACFTRAYDAAHLAAHPHQNVVNISMFVESNYDQRRTNLIELGFKFRKLARPIEGSGDCAVIDGQPGLACSIDCDGGHFNVTTNGSTGATVAIPDPIAMWDPQASDDDPNLLPKGAVLGSDDKTFALERVDPKQCADLMTDDAKAAIFGKQSVAK